LAALALSSIMIMIMITAVLLPGTAVADPPTDAVLLDGLSVLAGGRAEEESAAAPVTMSDVGLEAQLLLVRRLGPAWRDGPVDERLWVEARRIAALAVMLARQARQMGETIELGVIEAELGELRARAGGPAAMRALLGRYGADEDDLHRWVEDSLLAALQVRYLRDRIDPPTERELQRRFELGGHELKGREFDEVRTEYRRVVVEEQTRQALFSWLGSALERGLLRLIR
jgi:hypothetical protein